MGILRGGGDDQDTVLPAGSGPQQVYVALFFEPVSYCLCPDLVASWVPYLGVHKTDRPWTSRSELREKLLRSQARTWHFLPCLVSPSSVSRF